MAPDRTLKDYLRETRLINQRAIVALAGALALTAMLVARLVYLQVVAHEHFTTLSRDNRVRLVALPPTRGLIYDRNGVLLAQNLPSFQLEVVPEQVENLRATVERLRHLVDISDDDIQRFYRLLAKKPRFESVPLRFNLSDEEVARFAVNRQQFPGVDIEARLRRNYPLGPLAAHVLGYVGRIDVDELQQVDVSNYRNTNFIGKVGVEKYYETELHGKVGVQQVEINAQGRALRVLDQTLSTPGQSLYLTIDTRLQAEAEQALGDYNGAIVALDPRNGEVLALVSKPSFDPNLFVSGLDPAMYAQLQKSADQPLFNRAIRGRYPPGSTLKPFVALAGLQYQVVTPTDVAYCPGWYRLKGNDHKYRCWRHGGHGRVDMDRALVESCDVYFYNLALALGIDRLSTFLGEFGFGSTTGIDLSGELPGLLPSREWKKAARHAAWFPGETLITGIGQGYWQVTPLQLAVATAALANHGLRIRPRVLYASQEAGGGPLRLAAPEILGTIPMSQTSHWDDVVASLIRVVNSSRGTARAIGRDAPYLIAGKTGTSQVFGLKQEGKYDKNSVPFELRDHALFIAFAPAQEPRIVVVVVAEHGGSGGATAAPIARRVLDAYFKGNTP
jgi:penicillin-binding protein 2